MGALRNIEVSNWPDLPLRGRVRRVAVGRSQIDGYPDYFPTQCGPFMTAAM